MSWTGRQFHNQPEASHQHGFLVDLWRDVSARTLGQVEIAVIPRNGEEPGSDPRVLEMIVSGELEFATMMGPLIANRVPAAEVQGVPFAFTNSTQVHRTLDGALGDYLRGEMAVHGIHALPRGTLENGFRQVCSVSRTVLAAGDLAGYRMRVPAGQVFTDMFAALGAEPVVVNIDGLHDALATGRVDGHENPLAITEVNGLYRLTKQVALTNHIWSGFNLIGNLAFWQSLPEDAQVTIHTVVGTHIARQRAYTVHLNRKLETTLAARGMRIDRVDAGSFQSCLGADFYRRLRERCGGTAWRLLEASVGKLPA